MLLCGQVDTFAPVRASDLYFLFFQPDTMDADGILIQNADLIQKTDRGCAVLFLYLFHFSSGFRQVYKKLDVFAAGHLLGAFQGFRRAGIG